VVEGFIEKTVDLESQFCGEGSERKHLEAELFEMLAEVDPRQINTWSIKKAAAPIERKLYIECDENDDGAVIRRNIETL
jgi:hypothetical protein